MTNGPSFVKPWFRLFLIFGIIKMLLMNIFVKKSIYTHMYTFLREATIYTHIYIC